MVAKKKPSLITPPTTPFDRRQSISPSTPATPASKPVPKPIPTTENKITFQGGSRAGGQDLVTMNVGGVEKTMTHKEYSTLTDPNVGGKLPADYKEIRQAQADFTAQNNPLSPTYNPRLDPDSLITETSNPPILNSEYQDRVNAIKENPSFVDRANMVLGTTPEEHVEKQMLREEKIIEIKGKIAVLLDFVRVGVTGKTPLKAANAQNAFSASSSALDTSINLVRSGELSYLEAYKSVEEVEKSITSLEGTTKGLASENPNWWIDNGQEISAQILREKAILENQKLELIEAKRQVTFGLQNGA